MAWLYLLAAGILEVVWAIGLKYQKTIPIAVTIGGMIGSFLLLSASLKTLPVGTAYAIWTGIGAAGTVLVGMLFFDEPKTALRLVFLVLIIGGIVGLKLTSAH
ncbi:multidrug efflux SMR transporter [Polycladomyces sp. WAk]|uniref:Multidrug efflux SMR transporter n=1 Tax=Polycladomyces zharkentensis TaxID=2807616 RepID=A0ABS2WGG1_9BACL|nr:multidrug efflux SMR transporter [Polycladomyces sp. WAk]MBN2908606.1 multidrug efflux SMR transporter [Polycladomyces sp. WAk]